LDPDVSGRTADGESLAALRLERAGTTELDGRIAESVERYLRDEFLYSLDISAAATALPPTTDPLEWFVSEDGRRGHCEFFAGTMVQVLQSLGIPARVVVGFRTSDYNPQIGRHTIRQSDAHAWVEALTDRGWRRFDPTATRLAAGETAGAVGRFTDAIRQWGEWLQYKWQNSVIAYDRETQDGVRVTLITEVDRRIAEAQSNARRDDADTGASWFAWLRSNVLGYLDGALRRLGINEGVAGATATIAGFLIVLLPVAALAAVAWFALERWRLRRRVRRIGLDDLPPHEAQQMAKNLQFYDELQRLLERHGRRRHAAQTPREFAGSLADLPPSAFAAVEGLTDVFYRVRYGHGRVTPLRRRWLQRVVDRLAGTLQAG
jgi:hypothetical protein